MYSRLLSTEGQVTRLTVTAPRRLRSDSLPSKRGDGQQASTVVLAVTWTYSRAHQALAITCCQAIRLR